MRTLLTLILLLITLTGRAETLLLVQGYLGTSWDWRKAGIVGTLSMAGWEDAGRLQPGPNGIVSTLPPLNAPKRSYTLALDSEAPLTVQAQQLSLYLDEVNRRHPGESTVLIGHSAGAVVSRLTLVQHPDQRITGLISIAGPHLGTGMAELGQMMGDSPLGAIAPWLGAGVLNRSQALYNDLAREHPGSILFWLNRQPHPQIDYVSVIRSGSGLYSDLVVPDWSQNMNNIPALRGASRVLHSPGDHALTPLDGALLVRILNRMQRI